VGKECRAVLQRRPLIIEPGGVRRGGGVESGILKMGIDGGVL